MITHPSPSGASAGSPKGALRWPHCQRLMQRWLRRWGFALAGWMLGSGSVSFIQSDAIDAHTQARQSIARLQQKVAALPAIALVSRSTQAHANPQNLLTSLPGASRHAPVWTDLQQMLSANGLRLLSLRPFSITPVPKEAVIAGRLSSQAVELRFQGRFEDWSRTWAAMTEAGPLCVIEQISVAAIGQTDEVQIDAVLQLWMRPGQDEGAWAGLAIALPSASRLGTGFREPRGRSLFAQSQTQAEPAEIAGLEGVDPSEVTKAAVAQAKPATLIDVLSEDPRQWPLAKIRLLGLWRQGSDQQAILSAGPHWAKVSSGQRVTLEGHRVASVTEKGVNLQLAQDPVIEILWPAKSAKVEK